MWLNLLFCLTGAQWQGRVITLITLFPTDFFIIRGHLIICVFSLIFTFTDAFKHLLFGVTNICPITLTGSPMAVFIAVALVISDFLWFQIMYHSLSMLSRLSKEFTERQKTVSSNNWGLINCFQLEISTPYKSQWPGQGPDAFVALSE